MSLSKNIKRCRKASGISQEYMGDQLNMNQSAYSRLERQDNICAKRLGQIASALGTTPDALHTYHETHGPAPTESDVELPVVSVKGLLKRKEKIIQSQAEEITFLRRQITYLQAVWHQYCGGGQTRNDSAMSQ